MRWIAYGVMASGLLACESPQTWIELPEPPAGAHAALFAFEGGSHAEYRISDLPLTSRVLESIDEGGGNVELAYYAESPEDLRLSPGVVTTSPGGSELPVALESYSAKVSTETERSAFEPGPLSVLRGFRLPKAGDTSCWTYGVSVQRITSVQVDSYIQLIEPLDDQRILLGYGSEWVVATRDSDSLVATGTNYATSTHKIGNEVYAAVDGDVLSKIVFDGTQLSLLNLTRFSRTATMGALTRLTGGIGLDGEPEIFGLTTRGYFLGYMQGARRVSTVFAQPTDNYGGGGVVWMGPGEVFAVSPLFGSALHLKDGQEVLEPIAADTGFSALSQLPDGRLVAGTVTGQLYFREEDGSWVSPGRSGFAANIYTLTPHGSDLFFAGTFGRVGRYSAGEGFCLSPSNVASFTVLRSVVAQGSLILAGSPPPVVTRLALGP